MYIYKKIISEQDTNFINYFGDKFFHVRSIKNINNDYKSNYDYLGDKNGKKYVETLALGILQYCYKDKYDIIYFVHSFGLIEYDARVKIGV